MPDVTVISLVDGRHVKCPRCWHWHICVDNFGHLPDEIAEKPKLAEEKLCDVCQRIILTQYPGHPAVPHILAALRSQEQKYRVQQINHEYRA